MNDDDLGLALERLVTERKRIGPSPALQQAVWAIPATSPPERRWLPRIDTEGFSMFSAVKFIAAAVIVVLFGGFLFTGILSTQQGDEALPAAVTESPSPITTDVLLPGVNLSVEEVEPGVFRLVGEGELTFDDLPDMEKVAGGNLVSGADGSVWLLQHDRFGRLGGGGRATGPRRPCAQSSSTSRSVKKHRVGCMGTRRWSNGPLIYSLRPPSPASRRGRRRRVGSFTFRVPMATSSRSPPMARSGPGGRTPRNRDNYSSAISGPMAGGPVADWPAWTQLRVSDNGDIWAFGEPPSPRRFVDGAWQASDVVDLPHWCWGCAADVGPDGTVWGVSRRREGHPWPPRPLRWLRVAGVGATRLAVGPQ